MLNELVLLMFLFDLTCQVLNLLFQSLFIRCEFIYLALKFGQFILIRLELYVMFLFHLLNAIRFVQHFHLYSLKFRAQLAYIF